MTLALINVLTEIAGEIQHFEDLGHDKLFDSLDPLGSKYCCFIQSNLFNTDTKETEPSVRFTEVSVL